ncbi:MAG TPA: hypothetical protein VFE62_25280, partial [Gemmataceae bacterium]|nr:hypothetical protein [Gemmataceae bacterium]
MFGLFSRKRPPQLKSVLRRPQLQVEALEARLCPTVAPGASVTFDTPVVMPNHQVSLSGHVNSANPSGFTVSFSGSASASTTTDSSGNFSLITSDASLGSVLATAVKGSLRATASQSIAVPAPTMSLTLTYASPTTVTLSGTVSDIDAGSESVYFTGVASGAAACDANGNFCLTTSYTS